METPDQFPAVQPNDFGTVAVALETATVLYRRGEAAEALRWLRRAAESAEKEGDDMRAVSLARAAAELREQLNVPPSVRPGAKLPSPPPAPSSRTGALGEGAPAASRRSTPPPLPSQPSSVAPPSTRSQAPIPSKPPVQSKPPPPSHAVTAASNGSKKDVAVSNGSMKDVAPSNGSKKEVSAAPEEPRTAARAEDKPAPSTEQRVALRVAIEASSQADGTLVVRILGEGDRAGAAAIEALLVPMRPGIDPRQLLSPPSARARH